MADTPAETRQANEKIPKKKDMSKYRWYIIGGLGAVAVLVFYFVNKSKANAASGATGTSSLAAMGIDPATNVPYAQEYANAYGQGMGGFGGGFGGGYGGGSTGPSGPRGATGPAGKTGPRGSGFNRRWIKSVWTGTGKSRHFVRGHWQYYRVGQSQSGSRTQAMTNAVRARRDWNTRIIPGDNRHTFHAT